VSTAEEAVAAVRAELPVLLPTDTVYGLCVSPHAAAPVERMYRLKGRDAFHPTAIVATDVAALLECVPELTGRAAVLTQALLPGPLTLVLPNPARRFGWLTGSRPETIGVRVPSLDGPAADVLRAVGALAATSANLSGGTDPRRLEDVPPEIREGCGAEIDGGELPGVPSTVVDLTADEPAVLREGAVPAAEVLARVRKALG
jgi:L-threonylcarbamoyladenylate synthase